MSYFRAGAFVSTLLFYGSAAAVLGQTAQPEMMTLKSTFIPGEKTIFYDDFTDMTADSPPPHFKVRGAAPELQTDGPSASSRSAGTGR